MEETISTSLMQKKVDDLTVGDALKINGVIVAVTVAVMTGLVLVPAAWNRFDTWRMARKNEVNA